MVGINTYQSLPNLKSPAKDAEAIAQALHTYGEFRVHRLPEVIQSGKPAVGQKMQVTLRELETALINLFKPKGRNVPQTALFYFSGHGLQRDAGIREGYLALSDSQPDKGFYGLSLFWLRRLLQESPVRQRVVILDCCHSGELLNFLEADPGAQSGTDRLFMAASREYETAFESLESPYSVFTQSILTGLNPQRLESGIVTNHSLTDYVNHALKGEIQQPLFESSGSEIILTRRHTESSSDSSSVPSTVIKSTDVCPYRGLEFFDEPHTQYFFGREELTATLIEQLKAHHFVAVVGASGIGKSSLVRAGMVTHLRREKTALGDNRWCIKLITPTARPLKGLAAAFVDSGTTSLERAEQLRRVEGFLHDGGTGLAQLVQASLPERRAASGRTGQEHARMLLVIDQFEEVFTLSQGSQAEQERQQFFNCLLGAAQLLKDSLSIVIVLRTDFLPKCMLYEGLSTYVEQHRLTVTPLKYEQIKATIVRPAQKVGLVCEPNLVYTMLLDISGAPGELPLLQYTLLELWQRRRLNKEGSIARLTLEAYQELGGVRGTLQKRATDLFHSLSESEQPIAKRIFLALTQLGEGTEDTRRRVMKSELISPAYPAEQVDRVLEKLVAAKLVITEQDVDVVHEALIRNWSLLRSWLSESRDMLRRLRRIEQGAQEWDKAGQPSAGDYLLSGLRLGDAEDLLRSYPHELSTLAQQFIATSQEERRRAKRESWQLQIAVPSLLLATLAIVFSQYKGSVQSQIERAYQLQISASRERAAITQSILQDRNSDPMAALLISRLAAEQAGPEDISIETQYSLRSALQTLRLQLELRGHTKGVHQIAFSPDQRYLATASADGSIRLWAMTAQTIYNTNLEPSHVLLWSTSEQTNLQDNSNQGVEPCQNSTCTQTDGAAVDGTIADNPAADNPAADNPAADIISLSFSPNGRQIAAVAKNSPAVKVWSVDSGALELQLTHSAVATHVLFSPTGQWIATAHSDRSISVWQANTGKLLAHLPQATETNSIYFSPDGQFLLSINSSRTVQLWRLTLDPTGGLSITKVTTLAHPTAISQAIFSPTGRWIATASADGVVRLWNAATGQPVQTFTAPAAPVPAGLSVSPAAPVPVTQIQFSPSEYTLAVADAMHQVRLWDVSSGQLRNTLTTAAVTEPELNPPVQATGKNLLNFNPSGNLLVTANSHETRTDGLYSAYLWDIQTGEQMGILPGHAGVVEATQFSPDGTYVATAGADGIVRLWAAEAGGELPSLKLPDAPVEWAMFIQDHVPPSQAASTSLFPTFNAPAPGSSPSLARPQPFLAFASFLFGQPESGQPESGSSHNQPSNLAKAIEPGGTIANLVTVTPAGRLQHWQILAASHAAVSQTSELDPPLPATAQLPVTQTGVETGVETGVQSFGQQFLAVLARPFHSFTSVSERTIDSPRSSGFPSSLSSPTAQLVVAQTSTPPKSTQLSDFSTVAELTVRDPALLLTEANQPQSLSSVALSPNGRLLATATAEGWIEIAQVQTDGPNKLLHRIQNRQIGTGAAPMLSKTMADLVAEMQVSRPNSTFSRIDRATLSTIPNQAGNPVNIRQLMFSADSQLLLAIADDFTVRLWNVQSGQMIHVLQGHQATVQQAQFSPNGQWVVTASWDKTVRIWQVDSGELVKTIAQPDAVSSASFSPNNHHIVIASWDGIARVYDVRTGEQLLLLDRHQKAILDTAFSPDGTMIATGGADGKAYLWDAQTGEVQAELNSNRVTPIPIVQISFSPDGQYVATLTKDGKVHLWAATWEMLLQLARTRSLRQLTPEECSRYLKLTANDCPALSLGN